MNKGISSIKVQQQILVALLSVKKRTSMARGQEGTGTRPEKHRQLFQVGSAAQTHTCACGAVLDGIRLLYSVPHVCMQVDAHMLYASCAHNINIR